MAGDEGELPQLLIALTEIDFAAGPHLTCTFVPVPGATIPPPITVHT